MPRIALILAGAGSLGSFEAGVLTELLYVLETQPATPDPYIIDIICGASAGAMTAALVARILTVSPAGREMLHHAWVNDIDMKALTDAIPPNSFLNKSAVCGIANRYLSAVPAAGAVRSKFVAARLGMTFMQSNMTGFDYVLEDNLPQPDKFTSTFYGERRVFDLDTTKCTDEALWKRIRTAAVASGSFPLAFTPSMMEPDPEEIPGCCLPLPGQFCYVDGGLFNNEPIKEAVEWAIEIDGSVDPKRQFILVDANLNSSDQKTEINDTSPLLPTAWRLYCVLRGEAAANDWLRSQRINNEIGWRDNLLDHLRALVAQTTVTDPAALVRELDDTANEIVSEKRSLFPDRYPAEYLENSLSKAAAQHQMLFAGLDSTRSKILAYLIFLLNSVAGLEKKGKLNIDVIYSDPRQTAGDRLGGFGGFFSQDWREYDFRLGRQAAATQLPKILSTIPAEYPREIGANGADLYANAKVYSDVDLEDADEAVRRRLQQSVVEKAKAFAKDYVPWLLRGIATYAVGKVVENKMAELLKLDGKK